MTNLIMNEIMDHGPRVGFDDIGQYSTLQYKTQSVQNTILTVNSRSASIVALGLYKCLANVLKIRNGLRLDLNLVYVIKTGYLRNG